MSMTPEENLILAVGDKILAVAEEAYELTKTDFQSRVEVVARQIIADVRATL